jgi:two-component system cell cycle sensor histidine kinase PleC
MTNTPLELPAQLDLEQFVAEQAHDLRSPFNHIIGFSKVLLNNLGGDYPLDLQREDLGMVYRSGQRALLLLNGLIDIARLGRREREVGPAEIEIKVLLEQSLAHWRKLNPVDTLQAEYQISTMAAYICADEMLLRQVLSSFVQYVAHYVEPQGKVTITVEEEPEWIVITVSSHGEKQQPFGRLDLQMQGYLGRAMVELQRGEIRKAEETDDGALIQFALPGPTN